MTNKVADYPIGLVTRRFAHGKLRRFANALPRRVTRCLRVTRRVKSCSDKE